MNLASASSRVLMALALEWAFIGCDPDESPTSAAPQDPPEAPVEATMLAGVGLASTSEASAKVYYAQTCASCHGVDGRGDGPAAGALNPKPKNFSNSKWQASVTDAFLAKVIVEGGAAVGQSPAMPPHVELRKKPELLKALVRQIRAFAHQ